MTVPRSEYSEYKKQQDMINLFIFSINPTSWACLRVKQVLNNTWSDDIKEIIFQQSLQVKFDKVFV